MWYLCDCYLVQGDSVDHRLNHAAVTRRHNDLVWSQPQRHTLLTPD